MSIDILSLAPTTSDDDVILKKFFGNTLYSIFDISVIKALNIGHTHH